MSVLGDGRLRLAAAVALAVLVADQATKAIVERTMPLYYEIDLFPGATLTHVRNTGAAFGVLAAVPAAVRLPLFIGVAVLAAVALVSFLRQTAPGDHWVVGAIGAILGGAVGNLVCRVRYGEVVDFVDLHAGGLHWPTFNVADASITIGVLLVMLSSLHSRPPRDGG